MTEKLVDASDHFKKRRKAVTLKKNLLKDPFVELAHLAKKLVDETGKLSGFLTELATSMQRAGEILEMSVEESADLKEEYDIMDAAIKTGDLAEMEKAKAFLLKRYEERKRKRAEKHDSNPGPDQG